MPIDRRARLAGLCIALPLSCSVSVAQDIQPGGIYHNLFAGGFSGSEWFQVFPLAGEDRYRVADIFGGGFNATITPDGQITLDGGVGTGSFSSPDDWVIRPRISGTLFVFSNVRAPGTTAGFPLELASPSPANPILSGTYRSLTEPLDARTGRVLGGGFETVTVTSSGTTFRITDPGGLFFQGVFESPLEVGFRVVVPTPASARYRTFPGSSINFTQNMLGRVEVVDANSWNAIILLQSRTPLGSQVQQAFRFTATRTDPLPAGDLDGDRDTDAADRVLLVAQLGLTALDDGFNVAGDLDGDRVITAADLAALDAILNPCVADFDGSGVLDLFDFLAFSTAFDMGEARADLDGDGELTLFDFLAFSSAFDAGCP